jgi:hypothetical protein
LFDGEGEGELRPEITQLARERAVYRWSIWTGFPGRGMLLHREIRVTRCPFPAPGRYSLTLFFDGIEIAKHFLDIYADGGRP